MNFKGATKLVTGTAVAAAIGMAGSNVLADDAADIEAGATGATVTYDNAFNGNDPVVNAILSAPVGALDGYTYKNWSFLVQDGTGSMDVFYSSSASTYAPTLGDGIWTTGTYSPFDSIPEIESPGLSIFKDSTGNALFGPTLTTISAINTAPNSEGLAGGTGVPNLGGYYLQLNNVTLGNAGSTWATHANVTTTITDSGNNSMTLFFWASSYSSDGAMGGTAVPTGAVDMTGFVDYFSNSTNPSENEAEFVPMTITSVPEPAAMSLCGIGSLLAGLFGYRFRKQA